MRGPTVAKAGTKVKNRASVDLGGRFVYHPTMAYTPRAGSTDWTAAGIWLLGAAVIVWVIWALWGILLPFILGAVVAYVLDPVVNGMIRHTRLSRTGAVAVLFVILSLLLALLIGLVWPTVRREVSDLATAFPDYVERVQRQMEVMKGHIIQINADLGGSTDILLSLKNRIQATFLGLGRFLGGQVVGFITNLVNIFLIPLIAFFLLKDKSAWLAGFYSLLPDARRDDWERVVDRINRMLAGYFRGTAIVGVAITVVSFIGFTVIGMPYALLLSVIRGIGILIPYVGFVFSIIPPLILAAISPEPWAMVIGIVVLFAATEFLQGFVLVPIIVGNAVDLHELTVMFALLVGGTLFGLWGIILALPAAAMIKIIAAEVLRGRTGIAG